MLLAAGESARQSADLWLSCTCLHVCITAMITPPGGRGRARKEGGGRKKNKTKLQRGGGEGHNILIITQFKKKNLCHCGLISHHALKIQCSASNSVFVHVDSILTICTAFMIRSWRRQTEIKIAKYFRYSSFSVLLRVITFPVITSTMIVLKYSELGTSNTAT